MDLIPLSATQFINAAHVEQIELSRDDPDDGIIDVLFFPDIEEDGDNVAWFPVGSEESNNLRSWLASRVTGPMRAALLASIKPDGAA